MIQILLAGLSTLVLSYFSIGWVRKWTEEQKVLDIPNERSSHLRPTSCGGGLPIVILTLAAWWLSSLYMGKVSFGSLAFTIGALAVAAVSWLDDLRSLPNHIRFLVHSLSAIVILWGVGHFSSWAIPFGGTIKLGWLGVPITFLWIVGLTNAYNFMDGIDGIAGGQAVVAGAGWAILGWLDGQPQVGMLALFITTTTAGFLIHNWPPARVFMGDVGSAFLGFTFAVLPLLMGTHNSQNPLLGVLLVWPFIFDTIFTFFCRIRKHQNVFAAHRSHLYQRLVVIKNSHRFVTLLYLVLGAIGAVLGMAWWGKIPGSEILVAVVTPLLCLGLWGFVARMENQERIKSKSGIM